MASFFSMGGYGSFIWASYGVSAVVLIALLGQSLRFLKSSQAKLADMQEEDRS